MRKPDPKKNTGKRDKKPSDNQQPLSNKKKKLLKYKSQVKKKKGDPMPKMDDDNIRLNKYLSNAGICSRRDADVLIQSGIVQINGKIVTEMGVKVKPGDVVKYDGATINPDPKRYVLLNKPKDFATTYDDPQQRKNVMSLVSKACKEPIYPIGKLDRTTTGLLLFTNDSDLAKKLTHPRSKVTKLYHVVTDNPVQKKELHNLVEGIDLEDGLIKADSCDYVAEAKDRREIGIEIHSGKNRIVRRMFEALGYKVTKLDRVTYAGLTKKDLPRGEWRHLTSKEIDFLRML